MNVIESGLGGMQVAERQVERTAARLSHISDPSQGDTVDLSAEMVALIMARNAFAVNARVVQTAEEMEKQIVDMLA